MSILSIMLYITVFLAVSLTVRYAVLRFLVWVKPNEYIELTYTNSEGKTSKRKITIRDENDAEQLALLLRELKNRNEVRAGR
ncbi:hypothetical protein AA129_003592 [Salmonella enterica subsp. enterica serovar Lexington]|nr:hypothetical protein [Salmonella enterica]EGZ4376810.1 hypothetical protein [Salmonella enterica subsp. enterica serovar Lexington]